MLGTSDKVSPNLNKRLWDLVIGWERASRTSISSEQFSHRLLEDLKTIGASSGSFYIRDQESISLIASSGDAPALLSHSQDSTTPDKDATVGHFHPEAHWQESTQKTNSLLQAYLPVHKDVCLHLQLAVNAHDDESFDSQVFADVAKAGLEILSIVLFRQHFASTRELRSEAILRAESIASLYRGTSLAQSMQRIAKQWAYHTNADRVSMVRMRNGKATVLATSAGTDIDRRSIHVVILQALAEEAAQHNEAFEHSVDDNLFSTLTARPARQKHLVESGCRRIRLNWVSATQKPDDLLVAIVSEWFTENSQTKKVESSYEGFVYDAVITAIARENSTRWWPIGRLFNHDVRRRNIAFALLLTTVALLLCFLPVRFTIPTEGKIVPATRHRLFSPYASIVTDVLVDNGQEVQEGQPLLRLRSAELDLREEQIRSELVTAKTQLASLAASRSGRRANPQASDTALADTASEESLKTHIAGLEKQLTLIAEQKQQLLILSPIAGKIDRWDLKQSLPSRPVAQGQYLIEVYSPSNDWFVELDVLDKDVAYLLDSPSTKQAVTFRLQSQPDRILHATRIELASSAHTNLQGNSVVRLRCSIDDERFTPEAIGATVWADVHCGYRALGFVWFRGLIEWFGRQSWF